MKGKRIVSIIMAVAMSFSVLSFSACKKGGSTEVRFSYPTPTADTGIKSGTNNEAYNYNDLKVIPVDGLRDDFIMGVDASMVYDVEKNGGKYYNAAGQEQDVFKIMASHGVNFFRVRVWNNPSNIFGESYGGGGNTVEVGVALAKRAQDAGMNVLVDFHYSDFWADPESQELPKEWSSFNESEIVTAVGNFTKNSLDSFKAAGVNVAMVQIGNEINNGMLFPTGEILWDEGENENRSFDFIARVLQSGIDGAKKSFPNIYTAIHLANGGNTQEFNVFFTHLERRKVSYDTIGLSYYPYYHGTLEALKNNMDTTSARFNKPVYVAEFSYGFTDDHNQYTANIYSSETEDAGKYLTGIQGQATATRDIINAVASVPNSRGLGVFYWEPAWLPVPNSGWATVASQRTEENGLNTWANQALFSYTGKVLPSINVFNLVRGNQTVEETAVRLRYSEIDYTINIAENETLPSTVAVETTLDAIRQFPVTWNKDITLPGEFEATGTVVLPSGNVSVKANVLSIRNFIKDPGFEKQGVTDRVVEPWVISQNSLGSEKVVKLDRKTDMRSGTTNLNWYHATEGYSFTVQQEVTGLAKGEYELSVYVMAPNSGTQKNTKIEVFMQCNGEEKVYELTNYMKGWGEYVEAKITANLTGSSMVVGIRVTAPARAWGHLDDWALIKLD